MKSEGPNQGLEWTNLVLGIGLTCAALMFTDVPAAAWTAGIISSLIQLCSAKRSIAIASGLNGPLPPLDPGGPRAPFLLGFGSVPTAMWTHVSIGLYVTTIAIIQRAAGRRDVRAQSPPPRNSVE